jgi:hypothetical protein
MSDYNADLKQSAAGKRAIIKKTAFPTDRWGVDKLYVELFEHGHKIFRALPSVFLENPEIQRLE